MTVELNSFAQTGDIATERDGGRERKRERER